MKNLIIIILLGFVAFLTYDYVVKSNDLGTGFWLDSSKEETWTGNFKKEEEKVNAQLSSEHLEVQKFEYTKIPFETVNWRDVTSIERNFGDIWFYTAENHNELIDNDFDWTKNDVLLLYITNKQYAGHEIIVKELTISTAPLGNEYNLIIDFKKTSNRQEPAKIYIVIDKDSLRKSNGELRLDYRIYDTSGNMIAIHDESDY